MGHEESRRYALLMETVLNKQHEQPFVCVVDGDPAVRDGLTYLCQSNGHNVMAFSTGAAFLRQLDKRLTTKCVICEAQLPDGSGVRLYQEFCRRGNDAPFALLLSRPSGEQTARALKLGIDFVWAKPLTEQSALVAFLEN